MIALCCSAVGRPAILALRRHGGSAVSQLFGPLAQLLPLGFVLVAPILVGIAVGRWLDGQLGTTPWLLLAGLLLGLVIGGYAAIRLVTQVTSAERR